MASDSSSGTANADGSRITVDSVLEALENLKEVNGSTLSSLKKYFAASSPVHIPSNDVSSQIKKALAKGIRDGKIAKFGKSKFSLGLEDEGVCKKHRRRSADDEEEVGSVRRQRSRKRCARKRSRGRSRRGKRSSRRRSKKRSRRRKKGKKKSKKRGRGRSKRRGRRCRRRRSRKRR